MTVSVGNLPLADVPIGYIEFNPDNPRADLGDLADLADSISRVGILQPVTVRPARGRYQLISGHRRVAAASVAGLSSVPAIVRDDLADPFVVALVENLHRLDLNPIDEAEAFDRLAGDGWSVQAIAEALSVSESQVYMKMRLLELPPTVRRQIRSGELAWTVAYRRHFTAKSTGGLRGRERPPTDKVTFRSESLFDFASDLRHRADVDELPERGALYREVAAHFEAAGDLLRRAAEIRRPMTCGGCGEPLATHPMKRCA